MKPTTPLFLIISLIISSYVYNYEIAWAESKPDYNLLARAIHMAENGPNNQGEAYGIHSVRYSSQEEAKAICIRTCRHKWLKWAKKGIKRPFLEYLSTVYCPKHSKRWLHSVTWFYEKFLKQEEKANGRMSTF